MSPLQRLVQSDVPLSLITLGSLFIPGVEFFLCPYTHIGCKSTFQSSYFSVGDFHFPSVLSAMSWQTHRQFPSDNAGPRWSWPDSKPCVFNLCQYCWDNACYPFSPSFLSVWSEYENNTCYCFSFSYVTVKNISDHWFWSHGSGSIY